MNGWKLTAIVFIVLFILETILFISIIVIGFSQIDKENQCIYNVCEDESYDSYTYDDVTSICECYTNGELIKMEYLP